MCRRGATNQPTASRRHLARALAGMAFIKLPLLEWAEQRARLPVRSRPFGPPCLMYYTAYRLWDRFRDRPWQQVVRRGLAPLTIGLVNAGGYVMARAGDVGWQSALVTAAAVGLMLGTRLNPLWILTIGGSIGRTRLPLMDCRSRG
jgi:chromate transporter